ncbi:PD-(D/E)XK nuclease family protein [Vibrio sp. WXL103]|uniref:PD-(D/E)XK nuclease family protein n=1 Tax=Vibrio sp. WXL103 TaxID=3450710 RepID=UPI003EC5C003
MDTQLTRIEQLLTNLKRLPQPEEAETTIFGIGGRGYYENPTTDILAFFFDSNASHGLDTIVLEALFECLPDQHAKLDANLVTAPEREVVTESGKRIDLLLEGCDWVMVLENKIYHEQNNPFAEYEHVVVESRYKERFSEKRPIYVVLSPAGTVPNANWQGVSYQALIQAIKSQLAELFVSQPLNKWTVLLREFIIHMESIMAAPILPKESIDFVLDNLSELRAAQKLQDSAIKALHQSLLLDLQQRLDCELNSVVSSFHRYPAIRFAMKHWPTKSDVVLFLDGRKGKMFCINYYASEIKTDSQRAFADEHLKESDCGQPWNEAKQTCRCYKARLQNTSQEAMTDKLVQKLELMEQFETELRPTLPEGGNA